MKKGSKVRTGEVIRDKMDRTVVVKIQRRVSHPFYGKTIRQEGKIKAHDAGNECGIGDLVRVEEVRPLSKEKRWRVLEVLNKGKKV